MTDRTLTSPQDLTKLVYDERGLIPVVTQDADTGAVLTVAWANHDALARTLETGSMHFWSRSRNERWHKGATSGNTQELVSLHGDCDGDTVLARVRPAGPACHTGDGTCFGTGAEGDVLQELWRVLERRAESPSEDSYTTRLLGDENLRVKKIGEESAELILALTRGDSGAMAEEAADLLYHTLVALFSAGGTLEDTLAVLRRRRNRPSGSG